jgi:hypothetical protein
MRSLMPLTYILVDFENVQPQVTDLGLLRGDSFRVLIFHGAHQNKFDVGMYKALQPLGGHVQLIQSDRQGPDVLDFHISLYLGRLLQKHLDEEGRTAARFFVISKDRGFDSLIVHVRSLGFEAHRVATIRAALSTAVTSSAALARPVVARKTAAKKMPAARKQAAAKVAPKVPSDVKAGARHATKPVDKPKQLVLASLERMGKKLPAKRKGLEHHIESHLGRKVGLDEVRALVEEMERDGAFRIVNNKVEYTLPKAKK